MDCRQQRAGGQHVCRHFYALIINVLRNAMLKCLVLAKVDTFMNNKNV